MINFVNLITVYGNHYLQFKIKDKFWVYKFCARNQARKYMFMAQKYSVNKALNLAKKNCVDSFSLLTEWDGWYTPEMDKEDEQKELQLPLPLANTLVGDVRSICKKGP